MNVLLYFHPVGSTSWTPVLDGVKEIAAQAGWHVQELNTAPSRANLQRLREFWNPIGAIVDAGGSRIRFSEKDLREFPIVFIDRDPKTLPANAFIVTQNSSATARLAARELLATGFKNFAYIPFPEKRHWSDERGTVFADAIRCNGKSLFRFQAPTDTTADSVDYLAHLRAFLDQLPKPCGIFAANDRTAEDVIVQARLLEIAIPEDLSIIGVDNYTNICERTRPTLSSIEPDFHAGGLQAAMAMLAIIGSHGTDVPIRRHCTFDPLRLVRRASTHSRGKNDPLVIRALDRIRREACLGLTAAQVVADFPCSRVSAENRFRAVTGESILSAIQAVRLDRARELLRNPNQQLKSIANFCGFKNQNSLCKFFLKETGMTMSAWRAGGRSCTGHTMSSRA